MAWIEAHQGLSSHPKTKRLARILNISTREAVGSLFMLWWWALEYANDGDISKYDATDIADALQWDRDPDELLNALINCGPQGSFGFIEKTEDGLFIHDWDKFGGRLFEKREKSRIRQAKLREKNSSNAQVTHDNNATENDVAVLHNITLHNITKENITEEDITTPPSTLADDDSVTLGKIINCWNEKLVPLGFPSVLKNTPARDKALKARINMSAERQRLDWWQKLFDRIGLSDFLKNSAKERSWFSLDWLLNENNLVKLLEGKYDNKTNNDSPDPPVRSFDEILAGHNSNVFDAEFEVIGHD